MLCTQFRVKCPTVFENSVTARHCFVTEDANVMKLIFIAARSLGKLWHGVFATGYPQAILGLHMLQHFSSAKTKISQLKRHLLMDERVKSFEVGRVRRIWKWTRPAFAYSTTSLRPDLAHSPSLPVA